MRNAPYDMERLPFSECRDIFLEMLVTLNNESNLKMSPKVIEKNLKFIEVCYNYYGSIHGLDKYLHDNEYMLHGNYGNKANFLLALENEVENFRKGIYLVGYYFNRHNKIERLLLGGKTGTAYKARGNFRKLLDALINPLHDN